MASSHSNKHFLVTLFLVAISISMATGRPLSSKSSTLMARLNLEEQESGSSTKCWDSLFELQSCTGEVILFFLNGETYLGPACCEAIRNIEHQCWPSMLGALGYTSQEGDLLLGYCDASENSPPSTNTTKIIGRHA